MTCFDSVAAGWGAGADSVAGWGAGAGSVVTALSTGSVAAGGVAQNGLVLGVGDEAHLKQDRRHVRGGGDARSRARERGGRRGGAAGCRGAVRALAEGVPAGGAEDRGAAGSQHAPPGEPGAWGLLVGTHYMPDIPVPFGSYVSFAPV